MLHQQNLTAVGQAPRRKFDFREVFCILLRNALAKAMQARSHV